MIIPESERSTQALRGAKIFSHPDMVRANEFVLSEYVPPRCTACVFVPCAKVKPYRDSPSHKNYDRVIFSVFAPEDVHVVAFGTCGVTPRELDTEYPFADYDFVLGDCNVLSIKKSFIELESHRLFQYLEKTRSNYGHRVAYCTGDFRKAMLKACETSDVRVNVVPREETLERCRMRNRKFEYGSLSNAQYLADLRDALLSIRGASKGYMRLKELENTAGDEDWYML